MSSVEQINTAWRKARDERCREPDGWLSLAGLYWLAEGESSVDFTGVQKAGVIGQINVDSQAQQIKFTAAIDVNVDGVAVERSVAVALSFDEDKPSVVTHDTLKWFVVKRGERFAIRLKDSANPVLKNFTGIDCYAIDAEYRVTAKFVRHEPPQVLKVANAIGELEEELCYGDLEFQLKGESLRLKTTNNPAQSKLFIVFADATSNKTTYGGGRFVYADAPDAETNETIIDFNQAYNPPCTFTDFCTCPLPLQENRLKIAIEAGEKKYGDH